jgi:hypothetical protein
MDDFYKQKIVYREISDNMNATLVESGTFINNKSYMITGGQLKYLLGILNSFLFNHVILQYANITGGKGSDFLEKICVPFPETQDRITLLVSKRLNSTLKDEIEILEDEIDQKIYSIYHLDDIEINYLKKINSGGKF